MTGWLVVFSLLLLVFVFGFSNFSIFVIHRKRTYVYVKYACFSMLVYPSKKKSKSPNEPKTTAKETTKDLTLFPLREIANFEDAKKHLPSLTLSVNRLMISVGTKEADKTAYLAVAMREFVGIMISIAEMIFAKVKIKEGEVYPSFTSSETTVDANIEVSFRFYQFLKLVLYLFCHRSSQRRSQPARA